MNIHDLETPSVLIDLDLLEHNLDTMQAHAEQYGMALRPHIKTHKVPEVARMQMLKGAVGITCQKISEAEVFAAAGFEDIFISYNILGQQKLAKLARLAQRKRITVTTDHEQITAGLAEAAQVHKVEIGVIVDVVTSRRRTGAALEQITTLAKQIDSAPGLRFEGLMIYDDSAEIRPTVQEALGLLTKAGLEARTVTGGGTGVVLDADKLPEMTEMRTGSYVYNDLRNVGKGWAKLEDCALSIIATVVSAPTRERVILDSGSKALSSDHDEQVGYGSLADYPEARIYMLNEEHALVDVSACPTPPKLGERVRITPWHACVVSNMHNQVYGVRGENVEVVWPVAARGMVW